MHVAAVPEVAAAALRGFARALARAAAKRDWAAAIHELEQKEPEDDQQKNASAR